MNNKQIISTISCETFNDLLPLYQEQLLSKDSEELLQQHACGCKECQLKLEQEMVVVEHTQFKTQFRFSRYFQLHNVLFILLLLLMQIVGMYFYYHSLDFSSNRHPILHQMTFTYFFYIPFFLTLAGMYTAKRSHTIHKIILILLLFVFSLAISLAYFYLHLGLDYKTFSQIQSFLIKYSLATLLWPIICYIALPLMSGFTFESVYIYLRNKKTIF